MAGFEENLQDTDHTPDTLDSYIDRHLAEYILKSSDYDIIEGESGNIIIPNVIFPPFGENVNSKEELRDNRRNDSDTDPVISTENEENAQNVNYNLSSDLRKKCLLNTTPTDVKRDTKTPLPTIHMALKTLSDEPGFSKTCYGGPQIKPDKNEYLFEDRENAVEYTIFAKTENILPSAEKLQLKDHVPDTLENYIDRHLAEYVLNTSDYDVIQGGSGNIIIPHVNFPPFGDVVNTEKELFNNDIRKNKIETNPVFSLPVKQHPEKLEESIINITSDLQKKCLLDSKSLPCRNDHESLLRNIEDYYEKTIAKQSSIVNPPIPSSRFYPPAPNINLSEYLDKLNAIEIKLNEHANNDKTKDSNKLENTEATKNIDNDDIMTNTNNQPSDTETEAINLDEIDYSGWLMKKEHLIPVIKKDIGTDNTAEKVKKNVIPTKTSKEIIIEQYEKQRKCFLDTYSLHDIKPYRKVDLEKRLPNVFDRTLSVIENTKRGTHVSSSFKIMCYTFNDKRPVPEMEFSFNDPEVMKNTSVLKFKFDEPETQNDIDALSKPKKKMTFLRP